MSGGDGGRSNPPNKVERSIDKYDLDGLGEELEQRWLGEGFERRSTRELAEIVNRRILAAALASDTTTGVTDEVDHIYHTLTADDESERTLVKRRLEQRGFSVDDVTDDFVSHQTIFRYLRDHRGVEPPSQSHDDRGASALDTIQALMGRAEAVIERTLHQLEMNEGTVVGDPEILIDTQVYCNNCKSSYDVDTLIRRGGCDCKTIREEGYE